MTIRNRWRNRLPHITLNNPLNRPIIPPSLPRLFITDRQLRRPVDIQCHLAVFGDASDLDRDTAIKMEHIVLVKP